jgi:FkbM family methyltransferase
MKIFILNIFVFVLRFLLKFLDKILSLLNYNFFYFRIVDKLKNEYSVLKFDNKEIKFYTPSYISRWRASNVFTKEPETIAWIKNFQLINNNIIFWDIGANVGIFSIYAASCHEKIQIYAHEPNFKNLALLSKNISINNFQNIISINQMPLSDNSLHLDTFFEGDDTEGGANSSFKASVNNSTNNYKIIGTNINFLLINNLCEYPNYMKIDIDGLEDLLLNGADYALNYPNLKSILIETDISKNETYDNVTKKLQKYGFKLQSTHLCNKNIYNLIYIK